VKWVLGALAAVVVLIGCVAWFGYRKLQQFATLPPVSTVTIAAPAGRVFASLASGDSLSTWMLTPSEVSSAHDGLLKVGDTIRSEPLGKMPDRTREALAQNNTWVVTALVPDKLVAMEKHIVGRRGDVGIQRRDSLIAIGDSTRIVSTFSSASMDSLGIDPATGRRGAVADMAVKVMMGAMRMQGDLEHSRMKDHIERRVEPAGAPRKTP
jgi:hypothetical protein